MMVSLTLTAMPLMVTGPDSAARAGLPRRSRATGAMKRARRMNLGADTRKGPGSGQGPRGKSAKPGTPGKGRAADPGWVNRRPGSPAGEGFRAALGFATSLNYRICLPRIPCENAESEAERSWYDMGSYDMWSYD